MSYQVKQSKDQAT